MRDRPLRVLVVDDDFAVAEIHTSFVEQLADFQVVGQASTGREALADARALRPDLMLLDIYLPDFSGIEVLTRLRAEPELDLDVVVITAAREVETVRSAMAGGVLHYLIKPFTRDELHARLEDYLAHRRLVQASAAAPLDQAGVDRLLGGRPTTAGGTGAGALAGRLPKGLARPTVELVSAALRDSPEPQSADGVARQLGMSRVAARRYLEHLVEVGSAQVQPRYGQAGRPRHYYRWTGT